MIGSPFEEFAAWTNDHGEEQSAIWGLFAGGGRNGSLRVNRSGTPGSAARNSPGSLTLTFHLDCLASRRRYFSRVFSVGLTARRCGVVARGFKL